ncbi:hypothetical protein C2S51_035230 [Perilla frutescens var. frutescens]|nr:hypothetical protein C2S51_035230 [Perilla frutescens var. frutescens]
MVLGMKSKHKKGVAIRVEYIVHIQQIRPWPASESLRSVQTVLLQWENGKESSGSFLSVAGESNIVFDESFMLPTTLYWKKAREKFRKNYLEFSLFEPRKDKVRGHLLGTASLNLADHGLIEDALGVNVPLTFKKTSNDSLQPSLALTLELIEKDRSNSSPSVGFSYEASLDGDGGDDDDSEIASFTDDDNSSRSSRTAGSMTFDLAITSPSQSEKSGYGKPSSAGASSDTWKKVKRYVSSSKLSERSLTFVKKSSGSPLIISSPSSTNFQDGNGEFNSTSKSSVEEKSLDGIANEAMIDYHYGEHGAKSNSLYSLAAQEKEWQSEAGWSNDQERVARKDGLDEQSIEERLIKKLLEEDAIRRQFAMRSDSTVAPSRKLGPAIPPLGSNKARLKQAKSVQKHGPVKGNNGVVADSYIGGKPPDLDIPNGSHKKGKLSSEIEIEEPKDGKNEWKERVEMLEEELREAAAIEMSLFSIVAEHSSSVNKVHAPARRLSRFYKNACRAGSQAKRASAARTAVSGLVLVSKACGNDVPRLTFWLSNSIMLRSIVSQIAAELPHSNGQSVKSNVVGSEGSEGRRSKSIDESDDMEDVLTFLIALERVESWLFSKIVESIWWQTFTPHMQLTVAKGSNRERSSGKKKTSSRRNYLGSDEQASFSIELWKKAFKDACERLCPIQAGGHECGCLSALVILVMQQLVNRLDVAMFNAILRESAEDMPTDPVSDPISDSTVLPVQPGKASFGAGAQLKNIIGNWSRWLTDLFGLEDDSTDDNVINVDGSRPKPFKAFRLLHALSDLMMLPFQMLADASTRKEVCPMFGPSIIKRALKIFVPDEFSPKPIPRYITDALSSEESSDSSKGMITSFPCAATATKYSPPPAALLTCVGEVGRQVLKSSRLSTLKKSYSSDDELDELDSPLTAIIPDSYQSSSALARLSLMPKEKGGGNVIRYQLLREIWRDDE